MPQPPGAPPFPVGAMADAAMVLVLLLLIALLIALSAGLVIAISRRSGTGLLPMARAAVLDQMSDAVIVMDPDGTVRYLNPAAIRLGRDLRPDLPADPVGRSFFQILGTSLPMQAPPADADYVLPAAGGGAVHLRIKTLPMTGADAVLLGFAVIVRDVTGSARRREELARLDSRVREQMSLIERLRGDLLALQEDPAAGSRPSLDSLTGLHDRRHLMSMIESGVERAAATGGRLAVVLLDIDRFRTVNERFGIAVGDELLAATARALKEGARAGDTVARFGGEEFVVLLPDVTLEQARDRAEQWRGRCATTSVEVSGGRVCATFSAGVATFPECGRTPEELLRAAADALYAAKAAGSDRVVPAPPIG